MSEGPKKEPGARHAVTQATRAKDGLLIGALLAGRTFDEAAQAAGVCRRTAYRMRQSPEFQKTYQAARDELLGAAVSALHSNAMVFVNALAQVCLDPKARGSEKATAADRGLNTLLRAVETLSLADRITKLEALVSERK
jgi:hypothetical protein